MWPGFPWMKVITILCNSGPTHSRHWIPTTQVSPLPPCPISKPTHPLLTDLVAHLPPQLHPALATGAAPPLPLSLLRARGEVLEVRTNQLRCAPEEVMALFKEVMGMQLPTDFIQEATTKTEGWLVGLHLLGLSLQGDDDPADLLDEVSGSQHYIQDYLLEEVFRRHPPSPHTFFFHPSILHLL